MKIVVAMDSFKGSLAASDACRIVAETIHAMAPEAEIVTRPMADGGEGTAAVIRSTTGGQWVDLTVVGPLSDMRVDAGFLWLADERTAVVEMAAASGLQLLDPDQRDPLVTTTYGTGQLIGAALERGAQRVLLAVGGSATIDGGTGAATALGWRFLDQAGRPVPLGGGALQAVAQIVPPDREIEASIEVLCDVDNPLCGPHGAAYVYGPQKGATAEMVETLDAALAHLAGCARDQLSRDVRNLPGAGAAGGLAAGAVAFMDARLVSGVEVVMAQIGLAEALADADWVITGEGCFDRQSLRGKVVSGVARVAAECGVHVGVIAGQVCVPPQVYALTGIETAVACRRRGMGLDHALQHSTELLGQATRQFVRERLCE
jgi:glycerate kinase